MGLDITTYLPCDQESADCDPSAVVTQMQSEKGKLSDDISQRIRNSSNLLKFAEKTKKPFPTGAGDYLKDMVLDIPQPSVRDVLDHQKRLVEGRPGNTPCDIPSRVIPYGSHQIEACLFAWAWQTDWFCKFDLAFKVKRQQQINQIKRIMETWSAGIWDKWVWRAYQRSVRNWVLHTTLPSQHGASGFPLVNPTSYLTVEWLDVITLRMEDAAGLIGSPMRGSWCIFIGMEECKVLFDHYYKKGSEDYGLRQEISLGAVMNSHKRYDADWEMNYYELNNYKFFCETRAPRYRERVGNETWDDALIGDIKQATALYGTESKVDEDYRNQNVAKYAETLIFNEEAVHWLTPPMGFTQDDGFTKARPYSYAGDFYPITPWEDVDPGRRKVRYHSEYVAGMQSVLPDRGAVILSLACHIQPEFVTLAGTLNPDSDEQLKVPVRAAIPALPSGTLQIQTQYALPAFGAGFDLYLRTVGGRVVKIATVANTYYCEELGHYLHSLTFNSADAGVCVPRECDPWAEVVVLDDATPDSTLLNEDGCELCGSSTPTTGVKTYVAEFTADAGSLQSITIEASVESGVDDDAIETAAQDYLTTNHSGAVIDVSYDSESNIYTITLVTAEDGDPEGFTAEVDDGAAGTTVVTAVEC